jgi:hypothetical protein
MPLFRRAEIGRGQVVKQWKNEIPERLQRWTAKPGVALVTSIMKGETSHGAVQLLHHLPEDSGNRNEPQREDHCSHVGDC